MQFKGCLWIMAIGLGWTTALQARTLPSEAVAPRPGPETAETSDGDLMLDPSQQDAILLMTMGAEAEAISNLRRAQRLYEQASANFDLQGDAAGKARALKALANVLLLQDQPMTARRHLEDAYDLRWNIGDRRGAVELLEQLARLYLDASDTTRARASYHLLRRYHTEDHQQRGVAATWLGTGETSWRDGQSWEAIRDLVKAAQLYQGLGLLREKAKAHQIITSILREHDRYGEAYDFDVWAQAVAPDEASYLLAVLDDAVGLGRVPEVLSRLDQARDLILTPSQRLHLSMISLAVFTQSGNADRVRHTARNLTRLMERIPMSGHEVPSLNAVRFFLRSEQGLEEIQREALQGIAQVISVHKNALSGVVLRSQLDLLLRSFDGSTLSSNP